MLNADIRSVTLHAENKNRIVLKNIKFDIIEGKVYTILGKNGSGKSTLIKSLTSLLPADLYEVDGNVLFEETNLLQAPEKKLREIRKYNIRYVFQDASNSLDPLKKIKYYFDLSNISPLKIEELLLY
ncbi:MAG: Peptide/nickel transport system ATP-binding protein, partial [Ignavibacteriaceae bacterium]|nr:Peptide/nickel transport system ATP-binding protein [Ignavibacteriaceae bacterium]